MRKDNALFPYEVSLPPDFSRPRRNSLPTAFANVEKVARMLIDRKIDKELKKREESGRDLTKHTQNTEPTLTLIHHQSRTCMKECIIKPVGHQAPMA